MKRFAVCLLLTVFLVAGTVPMQAGQNRTTSSRALRKQAKKQQKAMKKYLKAQRKAQKKALKQTRRQNANRHRGLY